MKGTPVHKSNPTVPSYTLSNGELFLQSTVHSPNSSPILSMQLIHRVSSSLPPLGGPSFISTTSSSLTNDEYHNRPSSHQLCTVPPDVPSHIYLRSLPTIYGYLLRTLLSLPSHLLYLPTYLRYLPIFLGFYCTFPPTVPLTVPWLLLLPSHLLRFYCTFPPIFPLPVPVPSHLLYLPTYVTFARIFASYCVLSHLASQLLLYRYLPTLLYLGFYCTIASWLLLYLPTLPIPHLSLTSRSRGQGRCRCRCRCRFLMSMSVPDADADAAMSMLVLMPMLLLLLLLDRLQSN